MTPSTIAAVVTLLLLLTAPSVSQAWIPLPATTFATLPADAHHPEGITADRRDNIYWPPST